MQVTSSVVARQGGAMAEEKTFFQHEDVKVTNARFMVGSQTFSMSNITSVKAMAQSPQRGWPVALLVVGAMMLAFGTRDIWGFAIAFVAVGAIWLFTQKSMYHVMLTTAGGETSALSSKQKEYIQKVVQALNDAIVARG